MYKKLWTFALIAAMIFTLTACTDGEKPQGGAEQGSAEQGQSEVAPDGGAQNTPAPDVGGSTAAGDDDGDGNVSSDTPVSNTPDGDTPVSNDGNSGSAPSGNGTVGSAGNGNTVDGYEGSAGGGNSSSAGNGNNGSKDPAQSTTPAAPKALTYEEYHALSGDKQQQYYESFDSVEDFFAWYNAAKAKYEEDNGAIEIEDGEINLDEVIGGGK